MNEESSKKIILSILAVLIIVISAVGISFAVFTYTYKGNVVNSITTGSIIFDFEDGNEINLTNHFPIDTNAGKNLAGDNSVCTFAIKGSINDGSLIYHIYAVPGDEMEDLTRFPDDEVFVSITSNNAEGITFTPNGSYGNAAALSGLANGSILLGSGEVTARTTTTRTYEVRMWVDSSIVAISDTGELDGFNKTYTTEEYSKMYYSMKIKVESTKSL